MSEPTPEPELIAELEFILLGPGVPSIYINPPVPGGSPGDPHEVAIEVRGMSVEQVGHYLGFLSRCILTGLEQDRIEPVEDRE